MGASDLIWPKEPSINGVAATEADLMPQYLPVFAFP